jgi:hypothetical protein
MAYWPSDESKTIINILQGFDNNSKLVSSGVFEDAYARNSSFAIRNLQQRLMEC